MMHTPRNTLFEVYLNDRRDLLVVEKGTPLPHIDASGTWRKKKGVLKVSDEIRSAVQRQGYYLRKLSGAGKHGPRPNKLALSFELPRDCRRLFGLSYAAMAACSSMA